MTLPVPGDDPRALLGRLFARVTARIDGGRLVAEAAAADPVFATATHVLAVGKAALPMLRGLPPAAGARTMLAIAPAGGAPVVPVAGVVVLIADHPRPSARSVAAAHAALAFVGRVGASAGGGAAAGGPAQRLLVLLSGGASALLCAPADGITWTDKRDAIQAVARAGATIRELNVVRKHLSAIKGGQLALATGAPIAVRALSDVIGDDPATIGSGPFSADPSRFADAVAVIERLERLGGTIPAAVRDRLTRGARGEWPETPKPGTAVLGHVDHQVLAGPARVIAEARQAIQAEGLAPASPSLWVDSEETVDGLAGLIRARTRLDRDPALGPQLFIGNGEPRVVLPAASSATAATGRGGRATHLALTVARDLATLPPSLRAGAAFLAAGTDDRDGETDVSGAIVDGTTWARAYALGLDPERALRQFDSLGVLAATGDTIRGPGTSNLLDLHLLLGPFR